MSNVSADLIWEVVNGQNALLVKRKQSGGMQFSRDPMNLMNLHSRKYEGFVNNTAIGVQPVGAGKNIVLITKKEGAANKPKSSVITTKFGGRSSARKIARSVVGATAKRGYRSDLRAEAVARVSALKQAQRLHKEAPAAKPRGKKAQKTAAPATEESS